MWVPPVVTTFPQPASWASYKTVIHSRDSSAGTRNTRFITVADIKINQETKSHHNNHLTCGGDGSPADKSKSVNELPREQVELDQHFTLKYDF